MFIRQDISVYAVAPTPNFLAKGQFFGFQRMQNDFLVLWKCVKGLSHHSYALACLPKFSDVLHIYIKNFMKFWFFSKFLNMRRNVHWPFMLGFIKFLLLAESGGGRWPSCSPPQCLTPMPTLAPLSLNLSILIKEIPTSQIMNVC